MRQHAVKSLLSHEICLFSRSSHFLRSKKSDLVAATFEVRARRGGGDCRSDERSRRLKQEGNPEFYFATKGVESWRRFYRG